MHYFDPIGSVDINRDEHGFIDLTGHDIKLTEKSREADGNEHRIKNWVGFNGRTALLKEDFLHEFDTGHSMLYAELLAQSAASICGLPTCDYDIAKMQDGTGNDRYMSVSYNMLRKTEIGEEKLVSLYELTGNDAKDSQYTETSDLDYILEKLEDTLKQYGYNDNKRRRFELDFKKQLMFDICIIATDNHPKNYAYIALNLGGDIKQHIQRISPVYDRENSFLLDTDTETLKGLSHNANLLNNIVQSTGVKIALYSKDREFKDNEPWKGTFKKLLEDPDVAWFYKSKILPIDFFDISDKVEEKINTVLPEDVFDTACSAFESRQNEILKEFGPKIKEITKPVERGKLHDKEI